MAMITCTREDATGAGVIVMDALLGGIGRGRSYSVVAIAVVVVNLLTVKTGFTIS